MTGFFDIHTHILPNIDDGSKSLEMTKEMLQMEYKDGVRVIYATSHFRRDMFEPRLEKVMEKYEEVKQLAENIGEEGIKVLIGCEFHANMDMVETLNKKERPTMGDTRCVLVEFKPNSEKTFIKERCYALLSHGYQPIIAHIERYEKCRKDIGFVEELYDMGCYIQINSQAVLGEDGFLLKQFCKKLMKYDLVHFIATDAHNTTSRKPTLGKCAEYLNKHMGEAYTEKILIHNPRKYILLEKSR